MSRGLLIHNTKAGSLNPTLLSKIVAALGDAVPRDIAELEGAADAVPYARSQRCEWIAVAGGDGTVERIASTMVGTEIPLGVIPAGTYNNFARSLNLPVDPIEACQVIAAANVQPVD